MSDQSEEVTVRPGEDWTKMSDPEIMARLMRRGVEAVHAKGLVRDRDQRYAAQEIDEVLTKVYLDENDQPIKFEHPIDRRVRR